MWSLVVYDMYEHNNMYLKLKLYLLGGICMAIITQQTRHIDPMLG